MWKAHFLNFLYTYLLTHFFCDFRDSLSRISLATHMTPFTYLHFKHTLPIWTIIFYKLSNEEPILLLGIHKLLASDFISRHRDQGILVHNGSCAISQYLNLIFVQILWREKLTRVFGFLTVEDKERSWNLN